MEFEELVPKKSFTDDNWTEVERSLVKALAPIIINYKKPPENKFLLLASDETTTLISLQIWESIDQLVNSPININEIRKLYFNSSKLFSILIIDSKWLIQRLENIK